MPINEAKLELFLQRVLSDIGAAASAALVVIGDKLGLYRSMVEAEAVSSAELARRTGTVERLVREWLAAQVAAGYVDYDADTECYTLTPEQAMVLTDDDSPLCVAGAFPILSSLFTDEPLVAEACRTGQGIGWAEHSPGLFDGLERFDRALFSAHLVQDWLAALGDVPAYLDQGALVADVECGGGVATVMMAQAYPRSIFRGFDRHPHAIARARDTARQAGVADSVRFDVTEPTAFPGSGYDLVTSFNSLHDAIDPLGMARRVREALALDGAWLIVEPFAHDRLEENLTPVNRFYYAISTIACVPAALREGNRDPLGAQAGEARLRALVMAAGFRQVRQIAETPFHLVFEARP
jgi:SAM-dependent methyltransferase